MKHFYLINGAWQRVPVDCCPAKLVLGTATNKKQFKEILFFETLKDNINDNVELPYISRKALEKDYVSRKVSLLAEEDKDNEIKAFELMQEFDNMLMQQVANGFLEAPSKNLEKLYVNEQQFARISSYINGFKEKEGKSYKMGSRK